MAPTAEPTDYSRESEPRYGETCTAYRANRELHLPSDLMNSKKQNTMKRDKITISENTVIVMGGNVWMTEAEIVELFDTTAGAVYAGIKTLFKENALHDYNVCKCIRLDSGNSADLYNMEIVIALAFRLNIYPVSVFRKWLVKTATAPRRTIPPIVLRYKDGLLN